jgi:hypothetical protein
MAGEDVRQLERAVAELKTKVAALEDVIRVSGGRVAIVAPGSLTFNVGGNLAFEVGGSFNLTAQNQLNMQANTAMHLTSATTTTLTAGAALSVTAGAVAAVAVGGTATVNVGGTLAVSTGGSTNLSVGQALAATAGTDVTLKASRKMVVEAHDATTTIQRSLSTKVGSDWNIAVHGHFAVQATEASITAGSASIRARKDGDIAVKGKTIDIRGSNDVVVKAPRIQQN